MSDELESEATRRKPIDDIAIATARKILPCIACVYKYTLFWFAVMLVIAVWIINH